MNELQTGVIMADWISTAVLLPQEGEIVLTKIDDAQGCRNEAILKRSGRLWFVASGDVYVYYTPTHWTPLKKPEQE